MNEVPSEAELRDRVREEAGAEHRPRLDLIADLIHASYRQIGELAGVGVTSDARRLQLMLLTNSLNAAWCAFTLLTDGYPRMGLHFARFLREGHIAFRWSSNNEEDVLRHFAAYRAREAWPRGTWPSVGDMADGLPAEFRVGGYQQFQDVFRTTHNELFSHAISDFALEAAVGSHGGADWRPAIGPTYDGEFVAIAADHLIPLLRWVMVDTAEFVIAVTGESKRGAEIRSVLDRANEWTEVHPPPVSREPPEPLAD